MKMTKAQARKRLAEARSKVYAVVTANHLSLQNAAKIIEPLGRMIKKLE